LTVRLYSARPLDRIERVHCDTDSHTSVALMRILLREIYGCDPDVVDYDAREKRADHGSGEGPPSMLLIGDKVVTDSPPAARYPHQLDLGAAWKELTSLPFVFALWLARADADPGRLRTAGAVLDRQRRRNESRIASIVHLHAPSRGWPGDLAARYLEESLVYAFDEERRRALDSFFDRSFEHGLIASRRPLEFAGLL
jgi:chorismate dehydratase